MADDAESITIHSSWGGILGAFLGSALVLAVGLMTIAFNGTSTVSVIITVVGGLFLLGVLFDYPVAATFDRDGLVRHAPLRRHRIDWDDVRQLTRTRPTLRAFRSGAVVGGLTAVVGRRRYLLTNRAESAGEYDLLDEVLDSHELGVDDLRRPAEEVPPTWLYRRRHWRPDHTR